MAIARVAGTSVAGIVDSGTSGSIDTTGATLLVMVVSYYATPGSGPSDSKGNSWTLLRTKASGGEANLRVYYCASPTVGSGHTFTWTDSAMYGAFAVGAFSGTNATPVDQGIDNSATSTSVQAGSITPTEDGELVIAGLAASPGSSAFAIDESYTIEAAVGDSGYERAALAYKIQTTAAATNPTWSWSGSTQAAASNDSFKAAAAATGNPWYYYANQ